MELNMFIENSDVVSLKMIYKWRFFRLNLRGWTWEHLTALQAAQAYSLLDQGQIAGRALIDMGEWFPMQLRPYSYGPKYQLKVLSHR